MIQLKNIYKSWGQNQVLIDYNLTIPDNTKCCIVGMSGSGKSVTMKLILGLEAPDSGEVWIDGENVATFDEGKWRKVLQKFGVVFQNAALFSSLNVKENVGIRLFEEKKINKKEITEKVVYALEKVGLSPDILNSYPDSLSGGMRKRVGIARAIIHEPQYLIYDEPTTGLDPINSDLIDELILELAQNKDRTSIIITHDFQTVRKTADTISMLHQKKNYYAGSKYDFFHTNDPEIAFFLHREVERHQ